MPAVGLCPLPSASCSCLLSSGCCHALPPHCPQECAQEQLGESTARLRLYSLQEVRQLNAAGGCWLMLDGMVLDVTRWLPEHPGGSTIIPKQALNLDCRWVLAFGDGSELGC